MPPIPQVPLLHVLAGSNGAGKSTLAEVIVDATGLPFVNADEIAKVLWPGEEEVRARDASAAAAQERVDLLAARSSFITETVFSHDSKIALLHEALGLGYLVHLHVVMIPVNLAVARVDDRVAHGGHSVPEQKIRSRYERLWPLVAQGVVDVQRATVYDNTDPRRGQRLRVVARFQGGRLVGSAVWPKWTPEAIRSLDLV